MPTGAPRPFPSDDDTREVTEVQSRVGLVSANEWKQARRILKQQARRWRRSSGVRGGSKWVGEQERVPVVYQPTFGPTRPVNGPAFAEQRALVNHVRARVTTRKKKQPRSETRDRAARGHGPFGQLEA